MYWHYWGRICTWVYVCACFHMHARMYLPARAHDVRLRMRMLSVLVLSCSLACSPVLTMLMCSRKCTLCTAQHEMMAARAGYPSPLSNFTALRAFYKRFRALPQLEAYFASDAARLPCNNRMANFK